jgi:7,8-dihydropterin-6-yl-methyl-4-(beta-D-ribofuranosyl)aminobenzene 5'-phosphate synthase
MCRGRTTFHNRIGRVVEALVALEPAIIAPAHCTGYRAAYAVYQARPDAFVQNTVGTQITLSAEQQFPLIAFERMLTILLERSVDSVHRHLGRSISRSL